MLFSVMVFLFKQKTAYEMRISDWSSDVCSSDLHLTEEVRLALDATDYERNKGMAPEWRGRLIMMSREYGWFIYIPVLEESLSSEEYAEIPQCLRDCFDLARADGATWILFDRDESLIGDLPIYEG